MSYFDAVRQDLRYALRGIRRRPVFTAVVTTTLAFGIGANTMMFGILDRLLLHAPPHIADPDRVVDLCAAAGVRTINLDLPGSRAPSVISDNFGGAFELTRRVLANCEKEFGEKTPLLFIGGRGTDHNTSERVRGFRAAHAEAGVNVDETLVLTCGYAPEKAEGAMKALAAKAGALPRGMFVN